MHKTPYHAEEEEATTRAALPKLSQLRLRVPPHFRGLTLDDYAPCDESQESAKAVVAGYTADIQRGKPVPRKGLTLLGPPGVGKTMLACIVLNAAHQARKSYDFMPVATLATIRSRLIELDGNGSEEHALLSQRMLDLERVKFLVLDDVGKEYSPVIDRGAASASYTESELDRIIRTRWNLDVGPTIVTSNLLEHEWSTRYRPSLISFLHEASYIREIRSVDARWLIGGEG